LRVPTRGRVRSSTRKLSRRFVASNTRRMIVVIAGILALEREHSVRLSAA